jgi:hypothetical protein
MKKYILFDMVFLWCTCTFGQVYYASDDSISFTIKVATKKNSVDGYKITVINKANTNMFLCKPKSRIFPFYINAIDGPLIFGCGCEYGFNQDVGNRTNELEVIKIASKDTLRFEIKQADVSGRRITKKEFAKRNKLIKVDYVISDSYLLFNYSEKVYREFEKKKRRIMISFF